MTPEQAKNGATVMQRAIWDTADRYLRGIVEPEDYGDYIIPFAVLRRLECLLDETKPSVLAYLAETTASGPLLDLSIKSEFGLHFYNSSPLDLATITQSDDNVATGLLEYVSHFSTSIRDIWEKFDFTTRINVLDEAGRLYGVCRHFAQLDMHPDTLPDTAMGDIFEDIMYRAFNTKGKGAGAFYTPRDAIELMVDILFNSDDEGLRGKRPARSIYDPTAGTGGMLLVAKRALQEMNPNIEVGLYGQELMSSAFAIGKADLLIQGGRPDSLKQGNTLVTDLYAGQTFDYVLSNPPFGTDWSADQKAVKEQSKSPGSRFSHGLPPVSDGQMLFMSHVASKLTPATPGTNQGGRGAIVSNGSPLFTGAPESGPDKIRAWLLTSDLVDAIIALPTNMFYGTGIATYIWIFDTNKEPHRKGKIQLIDATEMWKPMRKAMGDKRRYVDTAAREKIVSAYTAFEENEISKILTADDLGYRDVPVMRVRRLRINVTDETKTVIAEHKDATPQLLDRLDTLNGEAWNDLPELLRELAKTVGAKMPVKLVDHIMDAVAQDHPDAPLAYGRTGKPVIIPGGNLTERIPLSEDVTEHMERDVLPFAPDAVWDETKAKVGYEIPFTRLFYKPEPTRSLEEIDAEVRDLMNSISEKFKEVEA